MRPGPTFEITYDMAMENIRTVAARLQVTRLSRRLYEREGSFAVRALERKFGGWATVVKAAGLQCGTMGRPKAMRRPCMEGCGRASMTVGRHCWDCVRRMRRQASGAVL